ncbi:MAG: HNH endonuclease signature motif containing protein [Prevotella sp.]|nr:HNH endonuclease signature motif containing protein [Prevotella sp.]
MAVRGNNVNQQSIPEAIKKAVKERDHYTCQICGINNDSIHALNPNWNIYLHVDHKIPFCQGGTNDMENLRTTCEYCNIKKSIEDRQNKQISLWDLLSLQD